MIPKLHKKGKSFRGAALYLLHDKGAETSERVALTVTRNLATNNPEAAWRVMAATALDAARLKAEAGVKTTGRKSKDAVLHLTLSWHPDEAEKLTHDEMIAAADGAVAALKAEGHQAMYVIHSDEPQPHIHALICRTSPEDGRMLSSSKEKLALSKWAETYEKERGHVYCEERVMNNASRRRGNYVRGKADRPRHIFELEAGNDNALWVHQTRQEQLDLDLALRRKTDAQKDRHAEQWKDLDDKLEQGKATIDANAKRRMTTATQKAGARYEDRFAHLMIEQHEERVAFAERENTLWGKGLNMLQAIDWSSLGRRERAGSVIKQAFGLLADRVGWRSEALRRKQRRSWENLEDEMEAAKERAAGVERRAHRRRHQYNRDKYMLARKKLELQQELERSWTANEWRTRRKNRELAWAKARERAATHAFEKEATPAQERQKAAEKFMGRMRKARSERDRAKGGGKLSERFKEKRGHKHERDNDWER